MEEINFSKKQSEQSQIKDYFLWILIKRYLLKKNTNEKEKECLSKIRDIFISDQSNYILWKKENCNLITTKNKVKNRKENIQYLKNTYFEDPNKYMSSKEISTLLNIDRKTARSYMDELCKDSSFIIIKKKIQENKKPVPVLQINKVILTKLLQKKDSEKNI